VDARAGHETPRGPRVGRCCTSSCLRSGAGQESYRRHERRSAGLRDWAIAAYASEQNADVAALVMEQAAVALSTCRSRTHSCSSAHSNRMQRQFRECGIYCFSTAHIHGSRLPRLRRLVPRMEVISAPRRTPLRSRRPSAGHAAGCSTRTCQRCNPMCKPRPPRDSLGQAREGMTVDAAYAVEQYCLSVNPSS